MKSGAFAYAMEADREDPVAIHLLRDRPAQADNDQGAKDQEDKFKIEAREASDFWRAVLSTEVGCREMYKVLHTLAHAFDPPFAASPAGFPDPNATFYKAGQVSVGQAIYQMLAINARDELFKMQDKYNVYGALAVRPDRLI